MIEQELGPRLVAVRALTRRVMRRLVTLRALHARLVVTLLAEDDDVPGGARGRDSRWRDRRRRHDALQHAFRGERLEGDQVARLRVTAAAGRARGVLRVGELGGRRVRHGGVAAHASRVRQFHRVVREHRTREEVAPDFLERRRLVRDVGEKPGVDVAVDALGFARVGAGCPGVRVGAHLVTGRAERRALGVDEREPDCDHREERDRAPDQDAAHRARVDLARLRTAGRARRLRGLRCGAGHVRLPSR